VHSNVSSCCSKVSGLSCRCCLSHALVLLHLQVKLLLLLLLHLLPQRLADCYLRSMV
jgi:hypothetical protein